MEAIVVVGALVALALAAPRWGVDSRRLNVNVVEMELALERANELRGEAAARRLVAERQPRPAPRLAVPRAAAFRVGTWLVGWGEALRARSVQSGGWTTTA